MSEQSKGTKVPGMPDPEAPARVADSSPGASRGAERETHPAYAMIGASRVSSGRGALLFGSDFRHGHFMTVTIRAAELRRDLSHDWHFGGREYISVALSEAQWATFVSSPNMGHGVACTLEYRGPFEDGVEPGHVPAISKVQDRREQFRGEAKETLASVVESLKQLTAALADPEITMSAKTRKTLVDIVRSAQQDMGPNLGFVAKSFDEHVDRTVEAAKAEVGAYLTAAVMRAGLQALGATPPVAMLGDGDEPGGGE
jgi:hypothetical protein